MLLQESCRERDLPPGRGKVTLAEIRAAQQGTRPRNPAVPAAHAAQSESPGLQAGEDVNLSMALFASSASVFISTCGSGPLPTENRSGVARAPSPYARPRADAGSAAHTSSVGGGAATGSPVSNG